MDQKTSLNVNIFLKQFKTDNASIVTMIHDGDSSKMSIDQLKALEKLLPDSPTVSNDFKMFTIMLCFNLPACVCNHSGRNA